jgi:hypothetical protein
MIMMYKRWPGRPACDVDVVGCWLDGRKLAEFSPAGPKKPPKTRILDTSDGASNQFR